MNKSVNISSLCPYTPEIAATGTVGSVYTTAARSANQGMTRIENTGNKITISGLFYSFSRHLEYIDNGGVIISTKQYPQNVEGTYELEFPEGASAVLVNSQGQLTIIEEKLAFDDLESKIAKVSEDVTEVERSVDEVKENIVIKDDVSDNYDYVQSLAVSGDIGSHFTTPARQNSEGYTKIDNSGVKINITGSYQSSLTRHITFTDADGIVLSFAKFPILVDYSCNIVFPDGAVTAYVNSIGKLKILVDTPIKDKVENIDERVKVLEGGGGDDPVVSKVWVELPTQTKRGRISGSVGTLASVDANTSYYHFFVKNDGGKYKVLIIPPNNMRSLTYIDGSGKVLGFNSNITDNQYHELEIDWSLYDNIDGVYICGLAINSTTNEILFVKLYQYKEVTTLAKESYESLSIRTKSPIELWHGKTLACYGDSVTELNQDTHYTPDTWKLGDYEKPYDFLNSKSKYSWAKRVATYVGFDKLMIRGVGSQGYEWQVGGSNGGQIVFCYKDTGRYIGRMNGDLSTWDGSDLTNYNSTWAGDTEEIISAGLADGTIVATRGAGCSWSRIKTMFPESIKDTIDVVLVMYHNDAGQDSTTEATFVPNDTTDAEWATSGASYYGAYGGDYNIRTIKGAIASMIMKMQLWMPNAVIVLMTPISGVYNASNVVGTNLDYGSMNILAEAVRDMHKKLSIPMIDVYATTGINVLNRNKFISDTIHPRKEAGSKMIARAVIGGLNSILPLDAVEYDEKNEL